MRKKGLKVVTVFLVTVLCISASIGSVFAYDNSYTVYASGHAHIDTAWQWNYKTTISSLLFDTWTNQIGLLNDNPDYKFSASAAQHYAWMKEYYPKLYDQIKEKVANGQWDIVGGQWDESEAEALSGESLVRQFLLGQKFFQNEFGEKAEVAFLPDDPGDTWILPQIAAKSDIKAFTSTRINALPDTNHYSTNGTSGYDNFNWVGVDGTKLPSYKPTPFYNSSMNLDTVNSALDSGNKIGIKKGFFYYGNGDMGGGPSQAMIDEANKINADPSEPNVKFSKMIDYFNSLTDEEKAKIPDWNNELYYNHELGLYTTHGELKKYNNDSEVMAETTEKLDSTAMWLGAASYPADQLERAWEKILLTQFHDVLPGSSVDSSVHDAWNDEEVAQNLMSNDEKYAMAAIASRADTTGSGVPVMVYNPLSNTRTDVVETKVTFDTTPSAIKVYDSDNTEIPSQIESIDGKTADILFTAENVPSVGYAIYHVQSAGESGNYNTGLTTDQDESKIGIENNFYRVEIDKTTGNVKRIYDKINNKEALSDGKEIELQKLEDTPNGGWEAWVMDYDDECATPDLINNAPDIKIIESGPVRTTIQVKKSDGASTYTQNISIYASVDRVDFPMTVDWHETNKTVFASFPLAVSNPNATYDLSYGTVQRGNRTDVSRLVPAQKWADLTNKAGDYGVSILSDCKYGWDKPDDSTLRLNLLRSAKDMDSDADMGVHNFTFSIYPHAAGWQQANTPEAANSMAKPFVTYQTTPHEGTLGKTFSLVSVNKPNVMVTAVKKAEDSNKLVFRLYESQGQDNTPVTVKFAGNINSLNETNLLEEPTASQEYSGDSFSTTLHKYELKTFAADIDCPYYSDTKPTTDAVNLSSQYNQDGISSNKARTDGNLDGAGHTIAAEQLPSTITSEDVTFNVGPKDDGLNNVVEAKGQTIPLNAGSYNTIYILATSTNGPRSGNYTVQYSDGSSTAKTITVNDWCAAIGGFGLPRITDKIGYVVSHRHNQREDDVYRETYLYVYKVTLDPTKTASSITLPDEHNIKVLAMSEASGGFLPAEENTVHDFTNDNTTIINDDSPAIIFSNGWTYQSTRNSGDIGGDGHYAAASGNPTVQFTFNGTGIDWITETDHNEGNVDVYIDDMTTPVETVNCHSDTLQTGVTVFSKQNLAQGEHKIKLVGTSGDWTIFDAFRVTDYIPVTTQPDSQPAHDDAIANDDSSSIVYNGNWTYQKNEKGGDYNSDIHYTTTVGDSCEFTFNGTDISFITEMSPDMGAVDIYIDGQKKGSVSCAKSTTSYFNNVYSVKGLVSGKHKIKVVMKSGGEMVVDGFKFENMPIPPKDAAVLNNNSDQIRYYDSKGNSGGWGTYGDRGFGDINDDVTATSDKGNYCELEFNGTGIYLFSETNSDEGNLDIYIDDVFDKTVSCVTSSRIGAQQVYGKNGLTPGKHKIKVVNASATWALLDAFKISNNTTGIIQGSVYDQSGHPVANANVTLDVSGNPVQTVTDATGTYNFADVPSGTGYSLKVSKDEYHDSTIEGIDVVSDSTTFADDIVLNILSEPGTGIISGKVLDSFGNAVEGATITADSTTGSAITGLSGNYILANVKAGAGITVTAAKDGYHNASISGVVVAEGNIVVADDIVLVKAGKGLISGRVLDESGNPVSGATVIVRSTDYSAITDSNGNYSIPDVDIGSGYTIVVTKPGYADFTTAEFEVTEGNATTLKDIVFTKSLPPETTGTIEGKVVDGSGYALSGADITITVNGVPYRAVTGDSGNYTLPGIPAGEGYTVAASKSGYSSGSKTGVNVKAGETNTIPDIVLTRNSGSQSGTTTSQPTTTPSSNTDVIKNSDGSASISVKPVLNSSGTASVTLDSGVMDKAASLVKADKDGIKTIEIKLSSVDKAKEYEVTVPVNYLNGSDSKQQLAIKSGMGTIVVPENILKSASVGNAQNATFSIAPADKGNLSQDAKNLIADKPAVDLSIKVNGSAVSLSELDTPLTVSVPYAPNAEEMKNAEHITVLCLDGQGNFKPVPDGIYDAAAGTVTFSTKNPGSYAVAYVEKTFSDMNSAGWAKNQVEVLASKGIISGTSESTFSPQLQITRADYLTMLMNELGLNGKVASNFDDVEAGAYYYNAVGMAKELGITNGTGNNQFNPKEYISRQDMVVLTEKALSAVNKPNVSGTASDLDKFKDKSQLAGYAADSMADFVKAGIISGSNEMLNPKARTTRAEAAALLYSIYNKIYVK